MAIVKLGESQVQDLKRRVDIATKFVKREWHGKAKRAKELYKGEHWAETPRRPKTDRPRIVVNYVRPAVETKVSNIAFNYPEFTLKPLNEEGRMNSEISEQVIRYDWRMMKAQREAKRALRDSETYGLGIVMDGWLFETEPVDGKEGLRVEGDRPSQAQERDDKTPDPPSDEEQFPAERVRTDRPFVKRISPLAFFVDPEADSVLGNARYCGFWTCEPLDDVKRDPRYKNTRQLKGTAKNVLPWLDSEDYGKEDIDKPADTKRVKLAHYYERARKLHVVFCDEHDKPLMVRPWGWSGDWYPFSVLRAADDENSFYPMPPPLWIEHQQQEINETRTQHSQWRRQSAPKYQTQAALEEEQRQRVASDVPGTVVENLPNPLTPIQHAPLPPEVLQANQQALSDLQFIWGLNDYETATPPTKRMTSAEVEAVTAGAGSRGAADRQAFEMFCAEIAEHALAWEQQYSARTRRLPIFDKNDQVVDFKDYTREQIAGEYLVEVYVGSTTAPNAQSILQDIGLFMQSLPNFAQGQQAMAAMGIDLRPLLLASLKALPWVRDIEGLLMPPQEAPEMAPGLPAMGPDDVGQDQGQEPNPLMQLAALMSGPGGAGSGLE